MRAAVSASILFVAVAVWCEPTGAQASRGASLTEIFELGNVAATRGDHQSAIESYTTLIDAGVRDPDVYFNLGTVYAQSGDYARAILNYERTLTLRPNDERASDAIRNAEQTIEEARAEAEGEATIRRSDSIGDAAFAGFTENALAVGLLIVNVVFFAALAWAFVRRERERWLATLLVVSGALLVVCALGLGVKSGLLRDGPRAVVLDDRVVLREGPDPRARPRGQARGGDRGQIVGRDRDFVKLRVVGRLEGWTPASSVGQIDGLR